VLTSRVVIQVVNLEHYRQSDLSEQSLTGCMSSVVGSVSHTLIWCWH